MTLDELKNKKVTITLEKSFHLGEDLGEEILSEELEDQSDYNLSDEEVINNIICNYYSSHCDLEDVIDSDDFKVTIHD